MLVEYDSNNSGGNWWLSDKDWHELEEAGWKVEWYSKQQPRANCEYCGGTGKLTEQGAKKLKESQGRRCFFCFSGDEDGKHLGALATKASKEFSSILEAIKEFEDITNQIVSDEGCNCCGPPHHFDWHDENGEWQYCSGESCLKYLFPGFPELCKCDKTKIYGEI